MTNKKDKLAQLEESLKDVDASLFQVKEKDAVKGIMDILLKEYKASSVAFSSDELLSKTGLIKALKESELGIIDPPNADMSSDDVEKLKYTLAGVDVGITSAVGISAETGTLLIPPHDLDERSVSLLPISHLAVIKKDMIYNDVSELMKKWQTGDFKKDGSAVMVTGPSRTADIEKELVLGIHGPQKVGVVVLT
jgi:L-lactate utilization protein LutC